MAALQIGTLATITLGLRQDGVLVADWEGVEAPELLAILDGGKEVHENAHTIAHTLKLAREAYERLNDDIKDYIT